MIGHNGPHALCDRSIVASRGLVSPNPVWVSVVVPRCAARFANGIAERIVNVARLLFPNDCGPVLRSLPCGVPAIPIADQRIGFLRRERAPLAAPFRA